jgi:hypothetical protein
VIDALADALQLDDVAAAHLHELAHTKAPRRQRPPVEQLPVGMAELVSQLQMPALVCCRYHDVLTANTMARAISPNFVPGRNLLHGIFLDPRDRELHMDWEQATAAVVGGLREVAGADPGDPRFRALVTELSAGSERFRSLWARADVGYRADGMSHLRHPKVGELHLYRNKLDIPFTDGQHLLIYHAPPGTPTAQALELLGRDMDAEASG